MFNFSPGPRCHLPVFSKVVSVVDLLAVVPVQALHLRVHDAFIRGGKHLGGGHVLVVPRVAVAVSVFNVRIIQNFHSP